MHHNVAQVIINSGNTRQGRLTIHWIVVLRLHTKEILIVVHEMWVFVAILLCWFRFLIPFFGELGW